MWHTSNRDARSSAASSSSASTAALARVLFGSRISSGSPSEPLSALQERGLIRAFYVKPRLVESKSQSWSY